jgi:SAM-dependent methyltransferase
VNARIDSYRELAAVYDAHRCDWYAEAFGPRLFPLLEERGFRGARVLDAGCGTGTLALALADRGHTVWGIDLSRPMLDAAREKDREGRITWREGDVTAFDFGLETPFDVITCVGDTLNHLSTLEDWGAAFGRFARHLRPGGMLYFDVMTRRGLQQLDRYTVSDLPDRAFILGFVFEPDSSRSTMKLTSFTRMKDAPGFERVSQTVTEWGQPVRGILDRLEGAGFVRFERLWGRATDPEDDERLSAIAFRA